MRPVSFALLVAVACSKAEEIPTRTALETTATTYVATESSDPTFDYEIVVIVRLRNKGEDIARVSQCTATSDFPPYWVEKRTTGLAAWNPRLSCVLTGTPYEDLRPGQERLDTLRLRAPWLRTVTGQPVGDIEGEFFLVYETRICALVDTRGTCYPRDAREYVRSNHFTVGK